MFEEFFNQLEDEKEGRTYPVRTTTTFEGRGDQPYEDAILDLIRLQYQFKTLSEGWKYLGGSTFERVDHDRRFLVAVECLEEGLSKILDKVRAIRAASVETR